MSLTGPDKHRFTIHFDVDAETFHILGGLSRVHNNSPNEAARDILLAWISEVSRTVKEPPQVKTVTVK